MGRRVESFGFFTDVELPSGGQADLPIQDGNHPADVNVNVRIPYDVPGVGEVWVNAPGAISTGVVAMEDENGEEVWVAIVRNEDPNTSYLRACVSVTGVVAEDDEEVSP